jgi:tetratricopeptide (TPR) repeat protein
VHDLFLSYNSSDREIVEKVARKLRERGIKPFLDQWYLVPGRSWVEALEKSLKECRAIAIFHSREFGRWQQREKELALDRQARDPAFPVIPILLRGAHPTIGFLQLNTWIDLRDGETPEALERLVRAARGQPPGHDLREEIEQARAHVCPYRALERFREDDESFFFGREALTRKLVEKLDSQNVIVVAGASGSGKSSVVRAGLIPALRHPHNRIVWDMVVISPGDRPLHSLATAFLPLVAPAQTVVAQFREASRLADDLLHKRTELRTVVDRALKEQPGTQRLLLFVDQWEELYTLCTDDDARRCFIDQLLDASAANKIAVVLTVRGDFYGHLVSHRALSDRIENSVIGIGPMTSDELRSAIVKPAETVGLRFEDGLVDHIVEDVGDEPGNLPLLSFLLAELWEHRRGGMLLHEAYDKIGGVRQAVAERAERLFADLSTTEQEALHWAMLRMVVPGQGAADSRRNTALDELDKNAGAAVERMVAGRLLVVSSDASGGTVVEVGHEALIREWARLRDWINRDREALRVAQRLTEEAASWKKEREPGDLLLQSARRIAEANELLATRPQLIGANAQSYIQASLAAEAQRQALAESAERDRLRLEAERAETARQIAEAARRLAEEQTAHRQSELEATRRQVRLTRIGAAAAVALLAIAVTSGIMAWRISGELERAVEVTVTSTEQLLNNSGSNLLTGALTNDAARDLIVSADDTLSKLEKVRSTPAITESKIKLNLFAADSFIHFNDTTRALDRATKARKLAEGLDARSKVRPALLSQAWSRIGDMRELQGDLEGAMAAEQAALKAQEDVAAGTPDGDAKRVPIVSIHLEIGDLNQQQGRWQKALNEYDAAKSLMKKIVDANPGKPLLRRYLANAYDRIGASYLEQASYDKALNPSNEALRIRDALVSEYSTDKSLIANLAMSLSRVGSIYRGKGDIDTAIAKIDRAIRLRNDLVANDGDRATYKVGLAQSHEDMARTLAAKGDLDGALAECAKALQLRQQLAKDAKNVQWQKTLAFSQLLMGDMHLKKDGPELALRSYAAAQRTLEPLGQQAALDAELFEIALKRGNAFIKWNQFAEAETEFKTATEIAARNAERHPDFDLWQAKRSIASLRFAEVLDRYKLASPGEPNAGSQATAYLQSAVLMLARLTRDNPDNKVWLDELAAARSRIAQNP